MEKIELELSRIKNIEQSLKAIKSDIDKALIEKNVESSANLKEVASLIKSIKSDVPQGNSNIEKGICDNIIFESIFSEKTVTIADNLKFSPTIILFKGCATRSDVTSLDKWYCIYAENNIMTPIIFGNENNNPSNSINGLVISNIDNTNKITISGRCSLAGNVKIKEWIAIL